MYLSIISILVLLKSFILNFYCIHYFFERIIHFFNIFRFDDTNDDFTQLASSLTDSIYIDTEVEELQNYVYGVSATYPENNNESIILIYPETISILPSSYQEFKWDDGSFESSFELESNDSLAMKFRAEVDQPIVRFKWYCC